MKLDAVVVGFALFAMFFGAGNLIFPPYLGAESGNLWVIGFICFVAIDVVLSCLGIYSVNAAGGSIVAVERVLGSKAGLALNTAAIICTGILIATPRTAATTFEMAFVPTFGDSVALLPFSVVFFSVVILLTFRQTRIVDIIGKVLTPLLVIGIVVLVITGIVNPIGPIGEPTVESVPQVGIQSGYQAMDIISVVGFAIVIKNAIKLQGYTDRKNQLRMIARASIVAGALLTLLYGGLTYLGASASSTLGDNLTQAQLIVAIVSTLMGDTGVIILGAVVGLACLTTAIGLTSATSAYFEEISRGRLPYRINVMVITLINLAICNLGLSTIVNAAIPILEVVCPPFMVTIILLLLYYHIQGTWLYRGAALLAVCASLLIVIHTYTGVFAFVEYLPLYSFGFGWLVPACVGGVLGYLSERMIKGPLKAPELKPATPTSSKAKTATHRS